jgi:isocitrate lyase
MFAGRTHRVFGVAAALGTALATKNRSTDCHADRLSSTDKLRAVLADAEKRGKIIITPCCGDPLTAKLVERAGFELTFMSGFSVSALHGMPDTQLISYKVGKGWRFPVR